MARQPITVVPVTTPEERQLLTRLWLSASIESGLSPEVASRRASQGTVEVSGRIAALLELGSGFNPEFNGIENARLNAAILGLSPEEIDARMDSILAFADIGQLFAK